MKKYAALAAASLAVIALLAVVYHLAGTPAPAPVAMAPPPAPASALAPPPAPPSTPPPAAPVPQLAPAPVPAPPPADLAQSSPALAPNNAKAPVWTGGTVGEAGITIRAAAPPAGFGLYVYELPGDQVAAPILDAIEQFNCADLEQTSAPGQDPSKSAIMVLPVKTAATTGPPVIDVALSHELLLDTVAKPDFSQVYVVIASAPVTPQDRPSPQHPAIASVIKIGYIAPPLVESWLARLRDQIEAGHVASPADFDLKIRSVMTAVGSAGIFIGIQSAEAAQPQAACQ